MPVTEHMFYLVDAGTVLGPPLAFDNGLTSVHDGGVVVFTGISSGLAQVTVDARDMPPPAADTGEWDEVVEVSVHAPVGRMMVSGVMNDGPDVPVLTVSGPGSYRIRLHARGRDTAVDQGGLEPVEDYLVVTWPAAPAPAISLKHTDTFGAGLRRPRESPRVAQADASVAGLRRLREGPRPFPRVDDGRAARRARLQAMDEKFRGQADRDG